MNEQARSFIDTIEAQLKTREQRAPDSPNPVLNRFFDMAREARFDPEGGPASHGIIYSAMELLGTEGDDDALLVYTSYRFLRDKNLAAKTKRGFQTGAIALSLVNQGFGKK